MDLNVENIRNRIIREYITKNIYQDPDTITDRTSKVKFNVPGSGEVINRIVDIFCTFLIKYEYEANTEPYILLINELAEELGFESQIAVEYFYSQIGLLDENEISNRPTYLLLCIGGIVETFQQKIIRRLSLRLNRKAMNQNKDIKRNCLESLIKQADTSLGLLINIEIIKEMSRIVCFPIKPLITDHLESQVINKIITN